MMMNRMRFAVATVVVWLLYSGFAAGNLAISEQIEYASSLERMDYDVHVWHFVGALAFVVFFTVVVGVVIEAKLQHTQSGSFLSAQCIIYAVIFYIMICTVGFFRPFTRYRELKLARDGIIGDRPSSLGCMRSVNASQLSLDAGFSYFTLEDPSWYVDHTKAKSHTSYGWTYSASPIVYGGSVLGCKFDPPLYAVCVAKGPTPTKCWYDRTQFGSYTTLRRLDAVHYYDTEEKQGLEKTKIPKAQMVEFNAPSLEEMKGYVAYREDQKHRMWVGACIAWAVATLFVLGAANFAFVPVAEEKQKQCATTEPTAEGATSVCTSYFIFFENLVVLVPP